MYKSSEVIEEELSHKLDLEELPKYSVVNNPDPKISAREQKAEETHKIAMISSSAPEFVVGQDPLAGELKVEETSDIANAKSSTSAVTVVCSNASAISETQGPTTEELHQISNIQSNVMNLKDGKKDVQHQYKMKLQIYAQKTRLGSPSYTITTEGPPHAPCFKSTVSINGIVYDSPGFYKTLKEAEHAAAQVALFSFSLDAFQQDDNPFYKNLLQELAQNEGFLLPAYKTIKSGESHKPTFFSTVEIEGEKFHGKVGKSKKQAEANAAKAAYIALTKRMENRVGDFTFPVSSEENESIRTNPSSNSLTAVDSHSDEHQGVDSTEDLSFNPNLISQAMITPPDLSGLAITDSPTSRKEGTNSYLLCNKVRVYTKFPDMKFPKGMVVLPIGDGKWVTVSLEFPNEINA